MHSRYIYHKHKCLLLYRKPHDMHADAHSDVDYSRGKDDYPCFFKATQREFPRNAADRNVVTASASF